jgi:hypothetical protein
VLPEIVSLADFKATSDKWIIRRGDLQLFLRSDEVWDSEIRVAWIGGKYAAKKLALRFFGAIAVPLEQINGN